MIGRATNRTKRVKLVTEAGQAGSMMGMGIQLIVTILGFAALGWWLDDRFGTKPWFLLAGLVLGATGGMISFIRTALRAGTKRSSGSTTVAPRLTSEDRDHRDEQL
jgi:F0F1-type ATP synthase assembly protein I